MSMINKVRLPNFVVIGAPKSGTTSLFFYMKQHKNVYLPVRKELHYFSYPDLVKQAEGPGDRNTLENLCSDRSAYEAHYADVRDQTVVGDVSPSYLYFSQAADRIKNEIGDVKIMALLRNPLEKSFSQYSHLKRDGRETLSFYDALMKGEQRAEADWSDFWRYAESSLYTDKLKHYLSVFSEDRVKIMLYDDLVADPDKFMLEVFTFLGIDPSVKTDTSTIYNRSGKPKSKHIAEFFAKPNSVKSLVKKIVPEQFRITVRLKILDMNTAGKGTMDEPSKKYLKEYFAKDVDALESLLGRKTYWLHR